MKKIHINICTVLIVLVSSTCTPKTDFDITDFDKKLVIWAYLKADEVVEINVSRTTSPLDNTQDRKITDATVLLYENDLLVDTLKHTDTGNYRSEAGIVPVEGSNYQIQIQHGDYPTLISPKDTVLSSPLLLNYDTNTTEDTVSTSFNYDTNIDLLIQRTHPYIVHNVESVPSGTFSRWSNNTLTCTQDGFLESPFHFNDYIGINYACLNSPTTISFSDRYRDSLEILIISLCYVSKNAANYHQKINDAELYTDDQTIDIFIEPVYLPQIVENGYGYFGTYNCTEVYIEL